jgi:predicted oxidoreductase (fatty acid repression mutant protein)
MKTSNPTSQYNVWTAVSGTQQAELGSMPQHYNRHTNMSIPSLWVAAAAAAAAVAATAAASSTGMIV